jgi:hypothetical protein
MDVVDLVALVLMDRAAMLMECANAFQTVMEETVEMMDVVDLVDLALVVISALSTVFVSVPDLVAESVVVLMAVEDSVDPVRAVSVAQKMEVSVLLQSHQTEIAQLPSKSLSTLKELL